VGTTLLRYQHADHLGSVSLELDGAAAVIGYEEYFPFGGTAVQTASAAVRAAAKRYRYSARERDEDETGLYAYAERYYAPWLGRWVSSDTVFKPIRANGYAFVRNNPVTFFDGDGNDEEPSGWNRFTGGLRCLGGVAQAVVGAAVFVQVEVPVAAQVVGAVAVVHGVDDMQAGFRQMISGRRERNATETVVTATAEVAGADRQTAERIGTGVDIGLGFVSPAPGANLPGASVRVPVVAAGRLSTGERVLVTGVREVTVPVQVVSEQARAAQLTTHAVTAVDSTAAMMSSGGPNSSSSSSSSNSSSNSSNSSSSNSSTSNNSTSGTSGGGTSGGGSSGGGTPGGGGGTSGPQTPSIWGHPPFPRGNMGERLSSGGRAEATLIRNFPTIDRVIQGIGAFAQRITSVKTMDLTAASYANRSGAVLSRINSYVDRLAAFTSRTWAGTTVTAGPATERVLELNIRQGTATAAQLAEIAQAEVYAAGKGVRLEVNFLP
jgi:RHS repeat-associated protein